MIGNPYKGSGFKGLLAYLYEGRRGEENPHRVIWTEGRNLPTVDRHQTVAGIMRATASLSKGVKKPVYHLPISWPPKEQLSKEEQLEIVDDLVNDLGLSEHQHLIVAHDDGNCPHVHVVINTVHPESGRVWNGWRDVYRIMENLERQEKERGLRIVDRPDLEEQRSGIKDPDRKRGPSRGEQLRAEREDDTPLAKWPEGEMRKVRKAITGHFKDATSWQDLEARLAKAGVHIRRAGQGFRITDGNHFMTMSKIGKHAREEKLEERFGETWEDYSFTCPENPTVNLEIEPPNVAPAENVQEHLDNLAKKREADTRREKEHQVREALQAFSRYHYHRTKVQEAVDLIRRMKEERYFIKRHDRAVVLADKDFIKADEQYDEACQTLYRNPKAARQEIKKQLEDGKAIDEIDLISAGKVKGWRFLNWRSKARKQALKTLQDMPKVHDRFERRRHQLEIQQAKRLTSHAKHGETTNKYNALKAEIGNNKQRSDRRFELYKAQATSLQQIDQNDIWQSSLPEDAKEFLAVGWEEHLQQARERERSRERGETAMDRNRRIRFEAYEKWRQERDDERGR